MVGKVIDGKPSHSARLNISKVRFSREHYNTENETIANDNRCTISGNIAGSKILNTQKCLGLFV